MDIFTIGISIFITSMFFGVGAFMVFVFYNLYTTKHNRILNIREYTAGKAIKRTVRARIMKHKSLGDIYVAPSLKKYDMHYIPFFGSSYEYPTMKSKQYAVDLSYKDGQYAPEIYNSTEIREIEVIEKDQNGEYIKQKINKELNIITPVKQSTRQWNLEMDTTIKDEYNLVPGFWEKYGHLVLGLGIVLICAGVAILMIVFGYKWATEFNTAPGWVKTLMESIAASAAPPPA